jgi:hypothetical protein
VGIAPLMVSAGRMYGVSIRWLEFIYNDHTPRFDFIVAGGQPAVYQAFWDCLLEQRGIWDLLRLCQLPGDSATLQEIPRLVSASGFRLGLWLPGDAPYLPMGVTWEEYLNGVIGRRGKKHRSNLRNRLKRLTQLGTVKVEEIRSIDDRFATALEEGLRIESSSWKAKIGTAICSLPDVHLFYTRFAKRAAARGWLDLHFLKLNDRRIAFDYSLLFKNKLYLLKQGYDPEFYQFSPYNQLCSMVLQDAFDRGIAEYDFLGTTEEWKLTWTGEVRRHYWLYAFPSTFRARLLHSAKFDWVPKLKKQRIYQTLMNSVTGWKGTGLRAEF